MVPGGAQTPDPNHTNGTGNSRIGSDAETADLVAALLATGYTPSALCAALTIDEDTLRRWRRGIQASHGMRKLMRCVLALRRLAPGLLAVVSMGDVGDLVAQLDGLTVRHLTAADVQREAITAEMKRMTWRDGAEGGGL
jgi:transposase-like protein